MYATHLKNQLLARKICRKPCFTLYQSKDLPTEKNRFVKILNDEFVNEPELLHHFFLAARTGAFLEHDSICNVYDYGREKQNCFIISEHVDMKPLSMVMHEVYPLALSQTSATIAAISEGLRYAHLRGIVHGLLNPTSVYTDENNRVKLDDFGFHNFAARLIDMDNVETIYLSHYLAPEVYKRENDIDGRADIYSLGAIFLQMLAGDFVFRGHMSSHSKQRYLIESLPAIESIYPENFERLDQILKKALHPDPEKRYCNFKALHDDLELLTDEKPGALRQQSDSLAQHSD